MNDNLPQTNRFQKNILLVNDRRELSALVKNYFEEETRLLNFAIVQTVEEVTHTKMYDLIVIYLTEKQNSTIDFIASLRAGRNATPLLLISTTSTNQELSLLEIGFGEIFYLAMNENRADHLTDLKEIFSKLVPEGIDIDKAISLQYKNEDWSIPTLSINDLIRMISKNFVNLAPTKIDEEINNTLRIIGEYVGAEVSYVNLFSDNQTKFFNSHEWTAKNVSSQSANFYGMTTEFPWGFSKTLKGEIVQVSDTNDMPDEAKIDQQKIREIGGKAYISAPLERQGKIIGYVGFSLRKQTRIWSDFDIDLLRTVGKLISSALEQKKAHYRMRYRHELDNMILTLSNNFINLPVDDIDQGINHALRNIANFIEVDVGILALFTSDLERISIEYTWSNNTEILENYPSNVRLSDYPQILEYISQSQDFYFSNISQIPKELIAGREIIEKAGLKSIASIPLMYSDRILGFLTFASINYHKDWSDEEITIIKIAGQIIINALERKKATLKLSEQNKELSDFAHNMSHDVNNKLMLIQGYAEFLMEGDETKYTQKIISTIEMLTDMLRASITLAEAGLIVGKKIEVNLNLLTDACAVVNIPYSIDFKKETLPTVKGDYSKLFQVFNNLFENAVTHSNPSKIRIKVEKTNISTNVLVSNNGSKINEEVRDLIFNKGFSTKSNGLGLGLTIVSKIINGHGWKIQLDEGEKTVFRIIIPNDDIIEKE